MPDEQIHEQIQETPRRKKQKEEKKLAFEIGKVFSPTDKEQEEDENLFKEIERDAATFRAAKGQAGTRRRGGGSDNPGDYVSHDETF